MSASMVRITAILVATLATSAALAAQSTYDKAVDAPPGGQLTVDADVGSISVVGSDIHRVVVHADLGGSESFLHGADITTEQSSSGVTVSAHMAHEGWLGWIGWLGGLDSGSGRVHFTIQVPSSYPVDLRTSGGNLDVRDLKASVHARTSGGGIRVERIDGPAQLSTSGGPIEVADCTGNLELHTSGGGIRIQDDDGKIDAATSGGSILARLRSNRGIRLVTSGGGITVLLPPNTQGSVDAGSSGGGVTSDFPITMREVTGGNHLHGSIGGGAPPIYLRTSGGSIRLERSP